MSVNGESESKRNVKPFQETSLHLDLSLVNGSRSALVLWLLILLRLLLVLLLLVHLLMHGRLGSPSLLDIRIILLLLLSGISRRRDTGLLSTFHTSSRTTVKVLMLLDGRGPCSGVVPTTVPVMRDDGEDEDHCEPGQTD